MITNEYLLDYATFSLIEKNTSFGGGRYEVTAIEANHAPTTSSVFYAIKADGKNMLYMHDSGMNLTDEAWNTLKKCERFDFVFLDATVAFIRGKQGRAFRFRYRYWIFGKIERTFTCGRTYDCLRKPFFTQWRSDSRRYGRSNEKV